MFIYQENEAEDKHLFALTRTIKLSMSPIHEPYTEPYTVSNESNSNASEYRKQMCHHKALTSLDESELKSNTSAKITTTLTTA